MGYIDPHAARGPLAADVAVAGLVIIASVLGFLFGRYWQQKIAIATGLSGLVWFFSHAAMLTNQAWMERGSAAIQVLWGRYVALALMFGLMAFINCAILLIHQWATILEICISSSVAVTLLFGSLTTSGLGHWVWIVAAIILQCICWYLGFMNSDRRDFVGYAVYIANMLTRLVYFLVWVLGPEILNVSHSFKPWMYSWLMFSINVITFALIPLCVWIFIESEEVYTTRKHILLHSHTPDTDGQPIHLTPERQSITA